ncbi:MAG TPA: hypothetical protein VEI97_11660, partial [bacterium]|nr:hypothetical protein [bacterium]
MINPYAPASGWWHRALLVLGFTTGLATAASAQWTPQNTNFPIEDTGIASISIVDANTVWAVGYDGTDPTNPYNGFTRTTNGGATWTASTIPAAVGLNFANVSAVSATTAWVAMYDATSGGGGLFKTTNGGTSWTPQNVGAFPAALGGFVNGIIAFDANTAVAVGDPTNGSFEIHRTTNGGTTWTRVASTNIPAPQAGEFGILGTLVRVGNTLWFGTNAGRVLRSTNQGQT